MGKLKKIYDHTFTKGVHDEDQLYEHMRRITEISHKPTDQDSAMVNGDVGDFSYSTILEKKIRIVLYIEE